LAAPGQHRTDRDGSICAPDRSRADTNRAAAGLERAAAPPGREGIRVHQAAERALAGGDGPALRPLPEVRAPVLPPLFGSSLVEADPPGYRACPRRNERSPPALRAFARAAHVLDVAIRVFRAAGERAAGSRTRGGAGQFRATGRGRRPRLRCRRLRLGGQGDRSTPLLLERPWSRGRIGRLPLHERRRGANSGPPSFVRAATPW